MSSFNIYRASQILAMQAVLQPDLDFYVRRIFRWYSKNFSTPLHEVDHLPLVDVLTAYYEETYDSMNEEHREALRARLAETDEETAARVAKEDQAKDDDEDFLRMIEEKEMARIEEENKKPKAPVKKLDKGLVSQESDLPEIISPPPDIKMSFIKESDMQDIIDQWDKR